MKRLSLLICLILAGCGEEHMPVSAAPAQGQYDQGYAWALAENIENVDECDDGEADHEFVEGCRTFVMQRMQVQAAQEREMSQGVPPEPAPTGTSDFDMGFAWAQQQDLNDAALCKKQRGTISYREGCKAYVKTRLGVNPNE